MQRYQTPDEAPPAPGHKRLRKLSFPAPVKKRARLTILIGSALAGLPVAAWAQAASNASGTSSAPAAPAVSAAPVAAASAASAASGGANADAPTAQATLAPVIVIGTAPLPGMGTPLSQVPANVQTINAQDIDAQHRYTLTDFFSQNLPSVDIADPQGNPWQMNVNYRGFTASPILGTPQGLSVFVDGVRVNEPFGDVVNWDLLPEQAISAIELIPGTNPVYGLNTLGGALSIQTKNGKDNPGGDIDLTAGSWGRRIARVEQGGTLGQHLDYYVAASAVNDSGWAEQNASRVRSAFGKLRYTDADTTLSLSAGGAGNDLFGSQTIPRSFLDNYRQPYTYPDLNENRVGYVTLSGERVLNDQMQLSGNLYFRHYRNTNVSSNNNTDYGSAIPDGSIDTLQGTNEQSVVDTSSYGASLQLTTMGKLAGLDNQWVMGLAADAANSRYTAAEQDAYFTDSRAAVGMGDFEQQTNAKTRSVNYGLYAGDTLALNPQWALTLSGRYDRASATIDDASGTQPLLNGNHTFSRFNPALGVTWNPASALTAYASYNQGMRTPTAIELACADPAAPCSLPNDFVADPALQPVISKTFELGARGRIDQDTTWSAAFFRTTLDNDIEFVSSNGAASTQGYFQNVGKTLRQGVELAARSRFGPLTVSASYSYVDATYRSTWSENNPSNSSADANGNITVNPGNHIPGIPASTIKLRLDYKALPQWNIGANLTWRGSIYAQGDENNQDASGKIPGYLLVDVDTTYQFTRQLRLFANVTNLFNKRYASYGVLGQNFFNGPNHTFDGDNPVNEQFVSPGAPRGIWVGLNYAWK